MHYDYSSNGEYRICLKPRPGLGCYKSENKMPHCRENLTEKGVVHSVHECGRLSGNGCMHRAEVDMPAISASSQIIYAPHQSDECSSRSYSRVFNEMELSIGGFGIMVLCISSFLTKNES